MLNDIEVWDEPEDRRDLTKRKGPLWFAGWIKRHYEERVSQGRVLREGEDSPRCGVL